LIDLKTKERTKKQRYKERKTERMNGPAHVNKTMLKLAVTEPGVWRWGVHENPDLPEAFHERRMHEFANLD